MFRCDANNTRDRAESLLVEVFVFHGVNITLRLRIRIGDFFPAFQLIPDRLLTRGLQHFLLLSHWYSFALGHWNIIDGDVQSLTVWPRTGHGWRVSTSLTAFWTLFSWFAFHRAGRRLPAIFAAPLPVRMSFEMSLFHLEQFSITLNSRIFYRAHHFHHGKCWCPGFSPHVSRNKNPWFMQLKKRNCKSYRSYTNYVTLLRKEGGLRPKYKVKEKALRREWEGTKRWPTLDYVISARALTFLWQKITWCSRYWDRWLGRKSFSSS